MGGWSSKDQDLRVGGPWGTNPVRNLVTRDPPFWRSGHEDAGSGPLVTRLRAEMVPRGPTSSGTWSPRNHLARCPRTPGPQGTRICVRMVPRGSASPATWSLVHHPPAAAEASWSRKDQDVVPGWSPEDHLRARSGPWCSTLPGFGEGGWQGWFPEDQIPSRTDPHGTRSTRDLVLGG
ncbi:MAG: hypothetical protein PWR07_473 [Bacillota bacterium]|nr:hypothetical protein [Bacillota bacterium]